MKKTIVFFLLSFCFLVTSCKKEAESRWDIEVQASPNIKITDISSSFYNEKVPFSTFKEKFGFFLSPQVPDTTYEKKRANTLEKRVYKTAVSLNNIPQLEKHLTTLFDHIKYYYPQFVAPKVYVFSSATELYEEPILYLPEQQLLFIDLSAFMGEKSEFYEGMELYLRKEMNPENLVPRVAETLAAEYVTVMPDHQKFLDKIINNGKLLILQDAFLPQTKYQFKIGYSKDQMEWSQANEENMYNYFVENDLLFSDDAGLEERFINKGPFSKFYTDVDRKSSPKTGTYIGWQICKAYLAEHPEVTLQQFLQLPALEIFNKSQYKPKK